MPARSVNRCIAIAAHGRRCQQTTYRGGPYCWHHTQSRKLPAPSRMQAVRRRPTELPVSIADTAPAVAGTAFPPAEVVRIAETPAERIVGALTPEQLDALLHFLTTEDAGVFRLDKVDSEVVGARVDPRLSRSFTARRSASG